MKRSLLPQRILRTFFCAVSVPASLIAFDSSGVAGDIFVEPIGRSSQPFSLYRTSRLPIPSSDIFCSYLPNDNRLGRDVFITLIESQGDSVFRYERRIERKDNARSVISSASNLSPNATVSRTLTFRNTSANQAGRRLINRSNEYADLLGRDVSDPVVRRGFSAIAFQFTCEPFERTVRTATNFSADNLPPLTRQATSIATLPDGNYRVASPAAITGEDADDAYSASTLFTFRKIGDVVTGDFEYLDSDRSACISGNVSGNLITGQAYTDNGETFTLGRRYLGPSLSLELGEAVTFRRYNSSTLDLNGFTRINAGTTQPPVGCS